MLGSQEILYLNIGQNYTLNCLSNIMTPEVLINDSEFMNTKLFLENEIQSAIYRETVIMIIEKKYFIIEFILYFTKIIG